MSGNFNEKIWEEVDKEVPGWMSKNEAMFLIENTQGNVYVEIGVAYGKSMRMVRKHFPSMTVIGLDKIDHGVDKKIDDVTIRLGDANDLVAFFQDNSIDTLFIDGDHTYEGCMKDFRKWYPKVKIGGKIIFHDYQRDSNHIGVTQTVDEIKSLLKDFKSTRFICCGTK